MGARFIFVMCLLSMAAAVKDITVGEYENRINDAVEEVMEEMEKEGIFHRLTEQWIEAMTYFKKDVLTQMQMTLDKTMKLLQKNKELEDKGAVQPLKKQITSVINERWNNFTKNLDTQTKKIKVDIKDNLPEEIKVEEKLPEENTSGEQAKVQIPTALMILAVLRAVIF